MSRLYKLMYSIKKSVLTYLFNSSPIDITISGHSMSPKLFDGEHISVVPIKNKEATIGDIVLVEIEDVIAIKRVIAKSGDVVEFNEGVLTINGREVLETGVLYDNGSKIDKYANFESYVVPEGELFLCGDNRPFSTDSRKLGGLPSQSCLPIIILD